MERLECPAQVTRDIPLGPIVHLLYKNTLSNGFIQLYLMHRNKHREAGKMRRQRNMSQIKEQNKHPEKELNKMKTSKLTEAGFKTLVIQMLSELRERVDKLSENFSKKIGNIKANIENIKKNQSEIENTLQGINSM